MDNIEFWVYIIFAVIYFIARGLRGNPKKKQTPGRPAPSESSQESRPEPGMSFEDLLEEITGKRNLERQEQELDETEYEEIEEEVVEKEVFEEGRTRQFADEESKRVYEESIKRAEGAKLEYGPDIHFASSKLMPRREEEEEVNPITEEIRQALANPEDARKAIVMQEILNRKY